MGTTGKRSYHHGDLRRALVDEGLALLESQGLAGLSLRAIAARAGVSHAAPKNHFGNLRGLLTAMAAEGFRRHAAAMREATAIAARPMAQNGRPASSSGARSQVQAPYTAATATRMNR